MEINNYKKITMIKNNFKCVTQVNRIKLIST